MNKKCFVFIILFSLLLLVSCNNEGEFQNLHDAKKALKSEENIDDDCIVNELDTENYHLLVYERNLGGSPSYALAYFSKERDGTVNLIGPTDKISMDTTKDGRSVGTKLELNDDNSVYFSFGEYKENEYESLNEKIEKGVIMIDEDRGIYYVIDVDISF